MVHRSLRSLADLIDDPPIALSAYRVSAVCRAQMDVICGEKNDGPIKTLSFGGSLAFVRHQTCVRPDNDASFLFFAMERARSRIRRGPTGRLLLWDRLAKKRGGSPFSYSE